MLPAIQGTSLPWVERAFKAMIYFNDNVKYFALSLYLNPLHWVLIIVGIYFAIRCWNGTLLKAKHHNVLLIVFILPLGLIFFYRNAYPYFYVFLISSVIFLSPILVWKIEFEIKNKKNAYLTAILFIFIIGVSYNSYRHYNQRAFDGIAPQRDVINLVHHIFPTPVPYIDASRMIASFPNAGFVMSRLTMESYTRSGTPIMQKILRNHQPAFMLKNREYLELNKNQEFSPYRLLEEDKKILRDNYIHHWGILYVAGKSFEFGENNLKKSQFEVLLPGTYTLESSYPAYINEELILPNETCYLHQGLYYIVVNESEYTVKLRWGKNLHIPEKEVLAIPVFHGYY
jgi:hypothetical protein